ncbi:MAG: hypothetical protein H6636_10175 [Anaerolineales bacterium]|nr:hypothetical protein [Anaerolineales bacterium]
MNVSPSEAEEALAAIQKVAQKTRRSIAGGGAHISLIVTGIIWLIGFMCTQFLSGEILVYIWISLSVAGSILATVLNIRGSKRVRSPSAIPTAKRIGFIWLLLVMYCGAAIAVAWPIDGKQLTFFIVLFVLVGYLIMGFILSYSPVWPGLFIIGLMLAGYFLLPDFFYLCMSLLGGGGMIFLGWYIRSRW